ncbi:hypothetical protein MLD38_033981 [Melastoma candidum]|uniref:Uncharacterized protein n=1 Tax=Melastoma candidum TaxID=119954 RepID=A0ACB9MAJ6_9MYRT|nr:hypothetical protein MLD38_033981 [Melastoma candidum]
MQERSHPIPNRTNPSKDRFRVWTDGGVVITAYVESSSHSNRHASSGDARRRHNGARECFDRRVQLLAYSRDLRRREASSLEQPGIYADLIPKRKKRGPRWFTARRKLWSLFGRVCRFRTRQPRWKQGYERVDPPAGEKRGFPFRVKLKINLRDLWSGCSRLSAR